MERLRQEGAVIPAKPGGLAAALRDIEAVGVPGLMEALMEQRDTER